MPTDRPHYRGVRANPDGTFRVLTPVGYHSGIWWHRYPTAEDAARAYDEFWRARGRRIASRLNFPTPEEQGARNGALPAAERADRKRRVLAAALAAGGSPAIQALARAAGINNQQCVRELRDELVAEGLLPTPGAGEPDRSGPAAGIAERTAEIREKKAEAEDLVRRLTANTRPIATFRDRSGERRSGRKAR
jgi:hypothetical protein